MATVQNQEDLEARIARIKKRNEELEKKHREAEEDRLRAMKENAMVEIRASKHDDWPREHKYDKIEFNYDLDPEALAQLEEKKKEKDAFIQKIAKEYKVFAEGEGPPPDPAYSFLADVERDGEKAAAANAAAAAAGNGSHAPSTNGTRSPPSRGDNFDRRNPHNRSGHRHPQGGGGGGGRGRGGASGKSHHGQTGSTVQRSYSTNEHDGWRSASGEQHRKSQGSQDGGLWRRESGGSEAPPRAPKEDAANLTASVKLEPNLRVSVSRDGDFKSVKVTSPPIIGSGRVGPRHPGKPQFQFHAGQGDGQPTHGKQLPLTRRQTESSGDQFNRNAPARKSDRGSESSKRNPGGHKGHSASATHNNNGNNTNGGAGNLQDRLNRNRQTSGSDKNDNHLKAAAQQPPVATDSAKATLKTISKIIEKNAAIDEQLLRENEKLITSKVKELRLQQAEQ